MQTGPLVPTIVKGVNMGTCSHNLA